MPKSNTLYRHEFNYKFGMLSVYAGVMGIKFIVFTYTRTAAEQNKRFKEGLSYCDGYNNISMHQRDRARDLVIIDCDGKPKWNHVHEYDVLAKFWKDLGGEWGGDWEHKKFDDVYHFQF